MQRLPTNKNRNESDGLMEGKRRDVKYQDTFDSSEGEVKKRPKKSRARPVVTALVLLVLVVAAFFVVFRLLKTPEERAQTKSDRDTAMLVRRVSRIALLPNEVPVVFVVTDVEVLKKEQQFFTGAQNGDKLLVFPQAAKAVIYNFKKNMIVNMGPITFDEQSSSQTTNIQPPVQQENIVQSSESLSEVTQQDSVLDTEE